MYNLDYRVKESRILLHQNKKKIKNYETTIHTFWTKKDNIFNLDPIVFVYNENCSTTSNQYVMIRVKYPL